MFAGRGTSAEEAVVVTTLQRFGLEIVVLLCRALSVMLNQDSMTHSVSEKTNRQTWEATSDTIAVIDSDICLVFQRS